MSIRSAALALALLSITLLPAAFGASAKDDEQRAAIAKRAAIQKGIQALKATVDMSKATEKPRFGKNKDGSLMFFGAPPGAPAKLDNALAKATPLEKAKGFLRQHAAAFGVRSSAVDFEEKRVNSDNRHTFVKLQQRYAGIPVFCGESVVNIDSDGSVGAVISDIATDTTALDSGKIALSPAVARPDAEAAAIDAVVRLLKSRNQSTDAQPMSDDDAAEFRRDLIAGGDSELTVFDPSIVGNTGDTCLAWKTTVTAKDHPLDQYCILIDAKTASVILLYPLVATACVNNPPLFRRIYDAYNTATGYPVRSEGEDDPLNPPNPSDDINLAYTYLGNAYDFYCNFNNRNSVDDAGMELRAVVRCCPAGGDCPWPQAMWTEADPNTPGDHAKILFGDGYVLADSCGHEMTHGVTNRMSGLIYLNESGAINESLSDIWGKFVAMTYDAKNCAGNRRWVIPWPLNVAQRRDMRDPPSSTPYPCPDRMSSSDFWDPVDPNAPEWWIKYRDWGGVHINCGVNDKLCYLLTDGSASDPSETGTFNGRTVAAFGIGSGQPLTSPGVVDLYYEAQLLLTSAADYRQLYYVLEAAALSLGFTEEQRRNIDEACMAVEIRPTAFVSVKDRASGLPYFRFTDAGDVILRTNAETVTESSVTLSETQAEAIVRNDQVNLASIEPVSGNLYLSGNLYEDVCSSRTPPDGSLVIRNNDEPVAWINHEEYYDALIDLFACIPAGSLILKGHVRHELL